jgi:hypothetical protein
MTNFERATGVGEPLALVVGGPAGVRGRRNIVPGVYLVQVTADRESALALCAIGDPGVHRADQADYSTV